MLSCLTLGLCDSQWTRCALLITAEYAAGSLMTLSFSQQSLRSRDAHQSNGAFRRSSAEAFNSVLNHSPHWEWHLRRHYSHQQHPGSSCFRCSTSTGIVMAAAAAAQQHQKRRGKVTRMVSCDRKGKCDNYRD